MALQLSPSSVAWSLRLIAIAEVHVIRLDFLLAPLLSHWRVGELPILHPAMLAIDCLLLEEFDADCMFLSMVKVGASV
jgi:hypothetical protein